jgi:hypothetical protein
MTSDSSTPTADEGVSAGAAREGALDAREERVEAREAAADNWQKTVGKLLVAADERDDEAQARDAAANGRDLAASLSEFLDNPRDTAALQARGAAALDRTDARADRVASKDDRHRLADGPPPSSDPTDTD